MLSVLFAVLIFSLILGIPALASEDDPKKIEEANKHRQLAAELRRQAIEDAKKLAERLADVEKLMGEQFSIEQKLADLRTDRIAAGEKELTQREQEIEREKERYRIQSKIADKARENFKLAQEEQAQLLARGDATDEELLKAGALLELAQRQRLEAEKLEQHHADGLGTMAKYERGAKSIHAGTASTVTSLTGLASEFEKTMLGAMHAAIDDVGGITAALGEVGKQLAKQFDPANLFASTLDKVIESTKAMVLATDDAFSSFRRTTGAGAEFDDVMMNVRVDTAQMGVTMQQAGAAASELFVTMSRFSQMTEEAQTEVVGFTTTMEQLGVAAGASSEFLNTATTAFRMTEGQAMEAEKGLAKAAIQLGLAPQVMMEGYNAALPQLAHWGDQAIEVFKGIAGAAKATGIAFGDLLGIVGRFDTFEGAAEAAGHLNAILGDDLLNSVDLLNASEEERIRMMIQSIDVSGRSWESMGRFEKRALANAAGISDMTTANQLFSQSLTAYDEQQRQARATGMSQEELEERAIAASSAMEKLHALFESMAIGVQPLVKIMQGFMNIIMAIQNFFKGWFVPVIFTVIGVLWLMNKAVKAAAALQKMLVFWQKIMTGSTYAQAKAAMTATKATWGLNWSMKGLAVSVGLAMLSLAALVGIWWLAKNVSKPLAIGISVVAMAWLFYAGAQKSAYGKLGLMISAFAILVSLLTKPKSPILYVAILLTALAVYVLGKAAEKGAFGLGMLALLALAVGAAVMLMGVGIAIAAVGISYMLDSLTSVAPEQLYALAGALTALAMAFAAIAFIMMMPFVSVGLATFAIGLFAVAEAFKYISTEKIAAFKSFVDQIKDVDKNVGINFKFIGRGIEGIVDAVDEVPVAKSIALTHVLDSMGEFTAAVTPVNVKSAKEMTGVIKEIAEVKIGLTSAIMWNKAVDNLIRVINAAMGGGGEAAGGAAASPTTVVLELDRRQLGRTVVDLVNERYNLRTAG